MDSFRCIHAARLLLDHQLHGLPPSVTGDVTSADRKIIQDATLLAFEQIVDQALARDVHCVLISGDCFDPADHGLRGPAALVRGISRLAEHDIAVVLHASRPDLWSSWPAGLRFPPNAHRLGANFSTSVSIAREGKLLATITIDDQPRYPATNPAGELSGWQIHLPAMHPLGANPSSGTIHVRDECKPAQGLGPDETGSHGFTLIEIYAGGEPRYTFIPAAPVRWERFHIGISPEMNRDDLLQEMAARLEQTRREVCEKIWLVAWNITVSGPHLEQLGGQLDNQEFRDQLLADLTELDPAPGVQLYTHALHVVPAVPISRPLTGGDAGLDGGPDVGGRVNDLAGEFAVRLEERFAQPQQALAGLLAGSAFVGRSGEAPGEAEVASLLATLDPGEIAQDVRRLTKNWFANGAGANSSVAEQTELST